MVPCPVVQVSAARTAGLKEQEPRLADDLHFHRFGTAHQPDQGGVSRNAHVPRVHVDGPVDAVGAGEILSEGEHLRGDRGTAETVDVELAARGVDAAQIFRVVFPLRVRREGAGMASVHSGEIGTLTVGPVEGEEAVVVLNVEGRVLAQRAEIVDATALLGVVPGLLQRRQQHGRQNGDDGDDHQELDQREVLFHVHVHVPYLFAFTLKPTFRSCRGFPRVLHDRPTPCRRPGAG